MCRSSLQHVPVDVDKEVAGLERLKSAGYNGSECLRFGFFSCLAIIAFLYLQYYNRALIFCSAYEMTPWFLLSFTFVLFLLLHALKALLLCCDLFYYLARTVIRATASNLHGCRARCALVAEVALKKIAAEVVSKLSRVFFFFVFVCCVGRTLSLPSWFSSAPIRSSEARRLAVLRRQLWHCREVGRGSRGEGGRCQRKLRRTRREGFEQRLGVCRAKKTSGSLFPGVMKVDRSFV